MVYFETFHIIFGYLHCPVCFLESSYSWFLFFKSSPLVYVFSEVSWGHLYLRLLYKGVWYFLWIWWCFGLLFCVCMSVSFFKPMKNSAIALISILFAPFDFISVPSSTPWTLVFGLFNVSQSSWQLFFVFPNFCP